MADVFISYRSLRVPAVRHLHRVLQAYGYSVWFDYALLSGEEFAPVIERELRDAKAAIVVWCQYSRDNRWVREEASLAQSLKTYLPVLMDPGDPPFGFRLDDTVDLTAWDGDPRSDVLDRLLDQLSKKTGKEATAPVRALTELQQIWRDNNKTAWAAMPLDTQKAAEIEKRRAAAKGLAIGPTAPGEAAPNIGYAPPPPPSPSPSAIRWARIEASLDPADYDDFLAVFDKAPEAFEARLHRRRLAAWAAIDQTDPEAIAAFLREPSFPALERLAQATMSRAAQARQEAIAAEEARRKAVEEARRAAGPALWRDVEAKRAAAANSTCDVFISYKREDREGVSRLADALEQLGLVVWFDVNLSSGEVLSVEIENQLERAKSVIVCWSPNAIRSEFVQAEAMRAQEENKLISVKISGPDDLKLPVPFNLVHCENLRYWWTFRNIIDPAFKSVLRRLGRLTKRPILEAWGNLPSNAASAQIRRWLDKYGRENALLTNLVEAELRKAIQRES